MAARAGPNLPSEDPRWDGLRDSIALGRTADPFGGVRWADESIARDGAWADPFHRLTLSAAAFDERDRSYNLSVRPRDLAGGIALSCDYQEGRPCGDGAGLALALDSAAGWGNWLTAAARVRVREGTGGFDGALELDRAYLKFEYGPFMLQAGRDVVAVGPAVRAGLQVSGHAAAQDGIRAQLRPVALPFAPWLRVSLFYFLDRLRDPQTFSGTLLDCTRMQLDFFDRVQFGGSRLLQLGGEGSAAAEIPRARRSRTTASRSISPSGSRSCGARARTTRSISRTCAFPS